MVLTVTEAHAHAVERYYERRLPEAREICGRILAAFPTVAESWHLLGMIERAEGRHAPAKASLEAAIALDPGRVPFHRALGQARLAAGCPDEALAPLTRAVMLAPGDDNGYAPLAQVCAILANRHFAEKRYAEAEALARRGIALDPAMVGLHHNLSVILLAQRRLSEALAAGERACLVDPGHADAHRQVALCHQMAGHPEAAAAVWHRALPLLGLATAKPQADLATAKPQGAEDGNAAILYHPDGFSTDRPGLMGRHTAGESFLRGFVRHAEVAAFHGAAHTVSEARDFAETVHRLGGRRPIRWVPMERLDGLAEPGCLFVPEPTIADHAWRRRRHDQRAYSLCGVTHTTASHGIMTGIAELLTAPVQPWDAVICTSQAVRTTVEIILGEQREYLQDRLGVAVEWVAPRMPVIPLGVNADDFLPDEGWRQAWRARLGIAAEDVAVLFVGRLCLHSKAHPLPMYAALEQAASRTGERLHLIVAGWFSAPISEEAYRRLAAEACPSVTVHFVDGRLADVRRQIWSAADVFTSLSDNIQETFGLTPLEAMAAGLPVVVSDWDGYRETVREGLDGFRLPTRLPPAGQAADLAARYEDGVIDYGNYCGAIAQFTAVDTGAGAEAFVRLAGDAALRRRMGESGRRRVREAFDWAVIVPRYQELWRELADVRRTARESAPRRAGRAAAPARQDPLALFGHYATRKLAPGDRLHRRPGVTEAVLRRHLIAAQTLFTPQAFPGIEDIATLLAAAAGEAPMVGALVERFPPDRQSLLLRSLVWLEKNDLVAIEADS